MAQIMAVMNLTPDSFSDGGKIALERDVVLRRAEELVLAGADWLDLGGESTRPGAKPVPSDIEIARVAPALEWIKENFDTPVSVDTSNPALMKLAISLGADMINDVRALQRPGAVEAVADSGLPVVLMHMQGSPDDMQIKPTYTDVVGEVRRFLEHRTTVCVEAGIARDRVWWDLGFGFGKALEHNKALFSALPRFVESGHPVLLGVSRKRMIGEITGQPVERRAVGSAIAAALGAKSGAAMLRVHDVAETRDALSVVMDLMDD